MKTQSAFRRRLMYVLLIVSSLFLWQPSAQADTIDDLAWLLSQLDAVNANPLPVSGKDIIESKQFFVCLGNASDDLTVIACVDQFKDTSLGQQAANESGIPSWFWDLVDLYVAIRVGDFWGIVENVGEAAICIAAQIVAGGSVDVCGLIQDLIEIAEAVLDAAVAVGEFFASAGEALWDAAKDVGCKLGLGGCDDPPPPPPEYLAYKAYFEPKITEGVAAIKAVDANKYPALRQQLENAAKAQYAYEVVKAASKIFHDVVDKQWTKDISPAILNELSTKRKAYNNPQQVAKLANQALALYKQKKLLPKYQVIQMCTDDFAKGFGFAHVDRWIGKHATLASSLGAKSNGYWCEEVFWGSNLNTFAQYFFDFLKTGQCPASGDKLYCTTVAAYNSCTELMASVNKLNQCDLNITALGLDIAKKIQAEFNKKGSKIPCSTKVHTGTLKSKPVDFVCSRPTQGYYCNQIYKSFNLPKKVLNCVVIERPNYTKLKHKVKQVTGKLTSGNLLYGVDDLDPLVVITNQAGFNAVKNNPKQDQGFESPSLKNGFEYYSPLIPRPIDGLTTPGLVYSPKLITNTKTLGLQKGFQDKLDLVKPGDPDPILTTKGGKPSVVAPAGTKPLVNTDISNAGGTNTTPMVLPPQGTKSAKASDTKGPVTFGGKVAGIKQSTQGGKTVTTQPTAKAPVVAGGTSTHSKTPGRKTTSTGMPDLLIESAQATVLRTCNPRQVVQINLKIRNNGSGNFSGQPGKTMLLINSRTGLKGLQTGLPPIGANKTLEQKIMLGSQVPFAELAGKSVLLDVQVNPKKLLKETNYANNTTKLTVAIPSGHCLGRDGTTRNKQTPPVRGATQNERPDADVRR